MNQDLKNILITSKEANFDARIHELREALTSEARFQGYDSEESQKVINIIREVGEKKNSALIDFTDKFDNVKLTPEQLKISQIELEKAHNAILTKEPKLFSSIQKAIKNVKKYQSDIFIGNNNINPGIKYTPLESVGICVPGASAPLPSTVIMTAVPAQVAGVKKIIIVSPPRHNGSIHPVILAVCHELGITEVYRVGGAQAVAALAYGTETIPKVCKIVGPGNKWVSTAKKMVFGYVDIDSIAGPSEVLILATDQANPAWVAADMLSQAEHNPGSAVVFTDSLSFAHQVLEQLEEQVCKLDRSKETKECLKKFSKVCVFDNMADIIDKANDFASEHLQIQCGDRSRDIAKQINNAGAIFIGEYTPVAVGDYWAGPSHTLPTGSTAKFFSAVTSNDFVKSSSIIEYSREQLIAAADDIVRLAMTEGLDAHAKSVQKRVK